MKSVFAATVKGLEAVTHKKNIIIGQMFRMGNPIPWNMQEDARSVVIILRQ